MKHKNFYGGSCINRVITIIIFFLFNSFFAQQQLTPSDDKPTTIFLSDGVAIYSSDDSFNDQISQKKITLKNADVSFAVFKNSKILVASTSTSQRNQTLAKQAKDFEQKKRKKALKDIQITIDEYKTKSKLFTKNDFNHLPSPTQFFSRHSSTKDYIIPTDNGSGFSKINVNNKDYSVKIALNYLHTQRITYYNSKSLDYCFSVVFSVRPPPVLV
jgi:hypothetical protein